MKPGAAANFVPFLLACGEGCIDYLYGVQHKDAQGKPAPIVTTAIGCALFSLEAALALDWRMPNGARAAPIDVKSDWDTVGAFASLAAQGARAYRPLMRCRLSKAAIDQLVQQRVAQFEVQLRPHFPGYDTAPDKAQEGLLRLAWATGAGNFVQRWPRFSEAFNDRDWATCAKEDVIPNLTGEPQANALESALFAACASGQGDYPTAL